LNARKFFRNYRMPAEWERHDATWLSWPKNRLTFPEGVLEKVEETFAEIVRTLSPEEKVNILVDDGKTEQRVSSFLKDTDNVNFFRIKSQDVWIRDYGPTFVYNGGISGIKWKFNAWGGKYEELLADDRVAYEIGKQAGIRIVDGGMVLEGGSIDVNGSGTMLTTEQCLLNANRNPKMSRTEIESRLNHFLGVEKIIWLKGGILGDDTDGHIDDVARFISRDVIMCMHEADVTDANHTALLENIGILKESTLADGSSPEIVDLPLPTPSFGDERLPASYANFYIGNRAVLVPTFHEHKDRTAIRALKSQFPEREVVGIDCRSLVIGLGTIHCATQQQPFYISP